MFSEFYNQEFFTIGGFGVRAGPFFLIIVLGLLFWLLHHILVTRILSSIIRKRSIGSSAFRRLKRNILLFWLCLWAFIGLNLSDLNLPIFPEYNQIVTPGLFLKAVLILIAARILDWFVSNYFVHRYFVNRDRTLDLVQEKPESPSESSAFRLVSYLFYVLAILLILNNFQLDFTFFSTEIKGNEYNFRLSNILRALLIICLARLLVWVLTQLILYGFYKRKEVEQGIQYAFNQLMSYFVYVFASVWVIQTLGIDMTLVWGGAAALLVGAGLGLQQTFNDLFSGVVILFERFVKVGDILDVGGVIGRVEKIGLRSSTINSRENITHIVPNSSLTNQNVINWSHLMDEVRFNIDVNVAYGSDTKLVEKLLIEAANKHPEVLRRPSSFVRFNGFGNSSLDFSIYFFSRNYIFIENIKSEIRFDIDQLFRQNNVTIPFPQRDVWLRSSK